MCMDFAMWSVPCQCDKCCCYERKPQPICESHANFKPYNDVQNTKLIDDYTKLSKGIYESNNMEEGCCSVIKKIYRSLLFVFYLCLFFPLFCIVALLSFIWCIMYSLYQIIIGFVRLYFCCNFLCCREYVYSRHVIKKMDDWIDWSFMTVASSGIEKRRFHFYKSPVFLYAMLYNFYWRACQYFAGLFTARLLPDEMIVYWVHLWSTTRSRFVYEDDRIRGIIDDYSSWSSDASVSEFWDNTTFEVLSVFIDYDDKCRITFHLRNGDTIMQPRFDTQSLDELTDEQLDELRIWNIHKAHYQCLLSIFPGIIHTWSHFHFNDLMLRYIETYWNDNSYDDDAKEKPSSMNHSVLNRIIRSHTFYTSFLNSAGHAERFTNPQTTEWNWCEFICAPWKAMPAKAEVIRNHFIADVTQHYFCDIMPNHDQPLQKNGDHHMIDLVVAPESEDDDIDSPLIQKMANPDAFPPSFVQSRLAMFEDREGWIAMHRGYSIYMDYLADYFEVIHEQFVVPLHNGGFITDEELTNLVQYLESNGYPGFTKCTRNGGYLHIFTTFLWLNVVHSSDHIIGNNLIRDFGIGASYVPMESKEWYKQHLKYTFVDVLEGRSCASRWRLQWHAMRRRVFWHAFGQPQESLYSCVVADHFIDSNLYKRFVDVDHINHQQRAEVNRIHSHFIEQMKQLDISYRWLVPIENITAGVSY